MSRRNQFRYTRSPRFVDCVPTIGCAAFAAGLTLAAITSASDFAQAKVDATDYYGICVLAAAAWVGTMTVGLAVWRRLKAYQNGEPAIAVDRQGITLRDMLGQPLDLKWSDVRGLELEQRSGKSALLIRAGSVSGAISLDGLNADPLAIWEVVRRSRQGQ